MKNKTHIENELNALHCKLPVCNDEVFIVPKNYFKNFFGLLMERIRGEKKFSFEKNTVGNTFAVPSNYFETLSSTVMQRIKTVSVQEELEAIAPTLASIPKTNVFAVPENYFKNLQQEVSTKIASTKPKAKVISISNRFVRIAVAACLAGIVTMWGLNYFKTESKPEMLAPDVAWNNVQVSLDNISDSVLNNFVDLNSALAIDNTNETLPIDEAIDLNDISDTELQNYISVTAAWVDKTNTSN